MNRGWSLVEVAGRLLGAREREAVLGDLAESGESAWRGVFAVTGLFLRREAALWKHWRPWLAGFGVALPSSLLLMGVSLSVSCTYERLTWHTVFDRCAPTGHEGPLLLLCHVLLLLGWAWTGGFVVGTVSRRTLWVSAVLGLSPCLFCLVRFRVEPLSRYCLLLFLLPAIWGVRQGLRAMRVKPAIAVFLAIAITTLTFSAWNRQALWIFNWVLIWPSWCLVTVASRTGGSASARGRDASFVRAN
jgi:hypothetical protein